MRVLLFSVAVIAGAVLGSFGPATATPLAMSGLSSQSTEASPVENIGWRRQIQALWLPRSLRLLPSSLRVLCASTGGLLSASV